MTTQPATFNEAVDAMNAEAAERPAQAEAAGFTKVETQDGREAYKNGTRIVWQIKRTAISDDNPGGIFWQTADLIDGRYRAHKTFPTFVEALARPLQPGSVPVQPTAEARANWIDEHAVYYTAVRGGIGNRVREEFETRTEAETWARDRHKADGRTMIYAVAANGASAHLGNV